MKAFLDDARLDGLKMQMLVYNALRFYDWTDLAAGSDAKPAGTTLPN